MRHCAAQRRSVGSVFGGVAGCCTQKWTIGLLMMSAMTLNLQVAALVGILVPITMHKLGRDPAFGSSVLLTFSTDSMGFSSSSVWPPVPALTMRKLVHPVPVGCGILCVALGCRHLPALAADHAVPSAGGVLFARSSQRWHDWLYAHRWLALPAVATTNATP